MKLRNKILLGILAILILLVAFNYKLVRYGIEQGLGQLEMVRNAVPIDDLLADPEYPDSLKQKLLLIKEIRRYAIDSLHLKDSKNYNAVYDLKGRPTAYVVQACEKYRIKKYLWKFPVVGKLPYKGFFDEEDAKKEAALLEKQGYDTPLRGRTCRLDNPRIDSLHGVCEGQFGTQRKHCRLRGRKRRKTLFNVQIRRYFGGFVQLFGGNYRQRKNGDVFPAWGA